MSTPAQISAHAARNRRRLYLVAGILLLLVVLLLGWLLGRETSPPPEEAPAPAEPTQDPADEDGFVPLDGEDQAHGSYPVQFPQTTEGAVSAAIHGLQEQSTNDADALAEVLTTYHSSTYDTEQVEQFLLQERALELQLSQPEGSDFDAEAFPDPAAYHYITPLGVWWEEQGSGTVEVAVLATQDVSDGGEVVFQDRHIYGRTLVWDENTRGGDWVVETASDPSASQEEYDLDHPSWIPVLTPDAEDEGT